MHPVTFGSGFRCPQEKLSVSRDATYDAFSGQFFRTFEIIIFCFDVAICDLVHAVEAMHGLP